MPFQINYTTQAVSDIDGLRAYDRSKVLDAILVHLSNEPKRESRSRVKRLQDVEHPQYRLRVDDLRVFYDVEGENVIIYRILDKDTALLYLATLEGLP